MRIAVQHPKDIIVKVQATALCGSYVTPTHKRHRGTRYLAEHVHNRELHVFRGHQSSEIGFIMGHEFVGTVVEAGSGVEDIKLGDKVVAPFTVSW